MCWFSRELLVKNYFRESYALTIKNYFVSIMANWSPYIHKILGKLCWIWWSQNLQGNIEFGKWECLKSKLSFFAVNCFSIGLYCLSFVRRPVLGRTEGTWLISIRKSFITWRIMFWWMGTKDSQWYLLWDQKIWQSFET